MVTRVTADLGCSIVPHCHWYWVIFNWTQKLVQELLSGNGKSALLNSVNEKEMVERHFCHFCSWRLQCSILIHTFIISSWLVMFSLLPIGPKYSMVALLWNSLYGCQCDFNKIEVIIFVYSVHTKKVDYRVDLLCIYQKRGLQSSSTLYLPKKWITE